MSTLKRAIEIATEAHKGQLDKSGKDYIEHPLRVMEMGKTEEEKIVGVLHDVIEDTEWTFDKLAEEGAKLVVKTLVDIENGTAIRTRQDDSRSNYAKMLKKELGNIDFTKSAAEIERLIRGLNPWPSAYTKLGGKTLKIWDAEVISKQCEGAAGEVVDVDKNSIYVKCGENVLAINELQLEGKKRMETSAFLLGFKVEKGVVLGE